MKVHSESLKLEESECLNEKNFIPHPISRIFHTIEFIVSVLIGHKFLLQETLKNKYYWNSYINGLKQEISCMI